MMPAARSKRSSHDSVADPLRLHEGWSGVVLPCRTDATRPWESADGAVKRSCAMRMPNSDEPAWLICERHREPNPAQPTLGAHGPESGGVLAHVAPVPVVLVL